MSKNYPKQHVFVRTSELRGTSRTPGTRRISWESRDARRAKYTRMVFAQKLIDAGLLNMKSVNRALAAKSDTSRKSFIKSFLPNVNDFKRNTWAFAYVGNGLFVFGTAFQHDSDQFSRKAGRETAYRDLGNKLNYFDNLFSADPVRAYEVTVHAGELAGRSDIPDIVKSEAIRMLQREEPAWTAFVGSGVAKSPANGSSVPYSNLPAGELEAFLTGELKIEDIIPRLEEDLASLTGDDAEEFFFSNPRRSFSS